MASVAVYLIDDDPLGRKALAAQLADHTDYSVTEFRSVAALRAAIEQDEPEVVIADWHMPDIDGASLIADLSTSHPAVVGLVMVQYGDPGAPRLTSELGPLRIVNKPFEVLDLELKIRAGLERNRLETEVRALSGELARAKRSLAAIEWEAKAATKRLVEAEQLAAVGRVVSGIAHEIGSQLALVGYAEAIKSRVSDDPELSEFAQIIVTAQRRLAAMVDEIRDFASGDTTETLRREPSELAGVIDEALAILRYERDLRDRKLERNYKVRPLASLHRQKFQQVVINLVSNAALATQPGATITVEVDTDADERVAQVSVIDSGVGMSDAVLARLGEPFFSTREGSGLGVGICRRILEEHGGRLEFESKVGQGTRATAIVPLLGAEG